MRITITGLALALHVAAPLACGGKSGGEADSCGGYPYRACADGFVCDADSHDGVGACHARVVMGSAKDGLFCASGGNGACAPRIASGEPCYANDECLSGTCARPAAKCD